MDTKSVGHPQTIQAQLDSAKLRQAEKSQAENSKNLQKSSGKDYELNLSSEAVELAKAREKAFNIARSTSEVREDRIAALKAKIDSGQYQIEPSKIADGMLLEAIRDELAKNSQDLA